MAIVPVESLERSGANAYEIAIAAAKEARRLNDIRTRRKKEGTLKKEEISTKVTVEALRRIMEGRAKIIYPSDREQRNHVER